MTVIDIPKKHTSPEQLQESLEVLASAANDLQTRVKELDARGDLKAEKDAIQKQIDDFLALKAKTEEQQSALEAKFRTAMHFDTSTSEGLAALNASLEPEDGMSKLFYNLLVKSPEELSYAASAAVRPQTRKLLSKVGMSEAWQAKLAEMQALYDVAFMTDWMLAANGQSNYRYKFGGDRIKQMCSLKAWKEADKIAKEFKAAAGTAMDTATSDQGLEWVPTMFSNQLHGIVQPQLVVASLFDTVQMPGPTYVYPVAGYDIIAFKVPETLEEGTGVKPRARTFQTRKMTLIAKKLGARILSSTEFTEDSIVPVIPRMIAQIGKAIARAQDDAVMNGDTSVTHMDADVTDSDDRRKIWKGLRYYALNGTAAVRKSIGGGGAANPVKIRDHLMELRKGMKQYGVPGMRTYDGGTVSNVVYIVGYNGLVELMLAKDDSGQNIFLNPFAGAQRTDTYLNGQIGNIMGSPVLLSEFLREDVDSTGVNSLAGPNDKGTILAVSTESFLRGERRNASLQRLNELYAEVDQIGFVGFWRGDFEPWYDQTVEPTVGIMTDVA